MACFGNEKPQTPQASDTISEGKIDGVILVRLPVQTHSSVNGKNRKKSK